MAIKARSRKELLSPQLKRNKHTIASTELALAKLQKVMPNVDPVGTSELRGAEGESTDKSG